MAGGVFKRWLGLLALLLPGAAALAQAPLPPGGGLRGEYYEGTNFEKFVLARRDATINFNWGQQPPAPGLPTEQFSVRWTGWLVPPTSGRYTFFVTVDDGVRLWLNDKMLLNEWRGQPLSNYTAAVELRAGEPYRLRVDYCQYGLDTRVFVTWQPPVASSNAPPSSWRNLWGMMTEETPKPTPIPSGFLYASNPRPAPPPPPTPAPPPVPVAKPTAAPKPRVPPAVAAVPVRRPRGPARPARRAGPADAPSPSTPAPQQEPKMLLTDSGSTAQLAQLAVGETVALPELHFDQGQAALLPPSRAALDRLAAALRAQPALRLEVQGHTDNVGSAELNRQLSQQRAEAVCLYLTAHGVAPARLQPKGYGGTQPVADNADPAQRPRNRRVVLRRL